MTLEVNQLTTIKILISQLFVNDFFYSACIIKLSIVLNIIKVIKVIKITSCSLLALNIKEKEFIFLYTFFLYFVFSSVNEHDAISITLIILTVASLCMESVS